MSQPPRPPLQGLARPESKGKLETREKGAAETQITAEQLLREAAALQKDEVKAPGRRIVDEDELNEHRIRRRKEFEDSLRRRRYAISIWLAYAQFEADQHDFRRARSVFERTLEIEQQNTQVWNRYLDMEEKNKFINSARNLYDRVTTQLPRIDHFWLRYVRFEEVLGNYAGARAVYERWMQFEPEDRGWLEYVKFEERCHELEKARAVLERFLTVHPRVPSFLKFAQWEEQHRNYVRARAAFEKALEILPGDELTENFFIKFGRFEERRHEDKRAKAIYLEGLRRLGRAAVALEVAYVSFQKRCGSKDELEELVLNKRRQHYEDLLQKTNYFDYDVWLNLVRLEESTKQPEGVRAVYERIIQQKPRKLEKAAWKRYFYLFMGYAMYEELETRDIGRTRKIWKRLEETLPHSTFSFTKFWTNFGYFEIRQGRLNEARLIMGRAIAMHPVAKVFVNYINLELKLGNLDRCRKIAAKFIEKHQTKPQAWLSLVDLELLAEEFSRARQIFEIAIEKQPQMGQPELLWKAYIDMEANIQNFDKCRDLYERLLEKTDQHWRVYKSLAEFEWNTTADRDRARAAFERGIKSCKEKELDEARALLLEDWFKLEQDGGDREQVVKLVKMQPQKIRKRRTIQHDGGEAEVVEEYTAYIFAEEGASTSSLAILEAARRWKKQKMEAEKQKPLPVAE